MADEQPSSVAKPPSSMDLAHLEALPTDVLARKLSFSEVAPDESLTSSSSGPEKMKVLVRVRPLGADETPNDMTVSDTAVAVRTVKSTAQGRESAEEVSFFFDTVYKGTSNQEEVFEGAMLPQVKALFQGRDTLTFAYGVTNAGKTYTIQGKGGADELGCIPRALEATFAALRFHEAKRAAAKGSGPPVDPADAPTGPAALLELDEAAEYEVKASFLEVYGNDAFDLLAVPEPNPKAPVGPPKRTVLRLKEDRGQVFVEGLKEVELPDLESAVRAVQLGWQQRASASNGVNFESSRSHAVLCVKLLKTLPGEKPTATRLCVVDLAGAERQKKTQTNGARLNEAMSINKDLMVLGHCLRDLRYNQMHTKGQKVPPFRDSRITMLFRDYLSGNGQISVIAAISPRACDSVGTLDTLKFAAVAQQVKIVDHVRLAPSQRAPAHLPKCAGGEGLPPKAKAPSKQPELARDDSFDSEAVVSLEAEASSLREQVVALQERLLSAEAEKIAIERSVREEVAAEMKEHLEATEAELRERMELERYNTEEMYHKKLQLVKGATVERANAASVQAHTEILQHTRDNQKRAAEHSATVRRLESDLEKSKSELDAARSEIGALKQTAEKEVQAAKDALFDVQAELEEEKEARLRAEEATAEAEERAKDGAIEVESLQFQLATAKESTGGLQKEIQALQARCASLVELQAQAGAAPAKSNRRASKAAKENVAKAGKAVLAFVGDSGGAAAPALADATNVTADAADDEPIEELKRSKSSLHRALAKSSGQKQQEAEASVVIVAGDGKTPKPSMLRQLRGKGLFGSKKGKSPGRDSVGDDESGVFLDLGQAAGNTPEPTPIARRTRAGRAVH